MLRVTAKRRERPAGAGGAGPHAGASRPAVMGVGAQAALLPVLGVELPWPLVVLVGAVGIAYLLAWAMAVAAASADREAEARLRVWAHTRVPSAAERTLVARVRRAWARWPLTELDPGERVAFADAVAAAEDFGDLDPRWQALILAAEGPVRPMLRRSLAGYRDRPAG